MPPWMLDVVLTVFVVALGIFTTGRDDVALAVEQRDRDAFAFALVLVATVPYLARRRMPLTVFTVSTAAVAALMLGDYNAGSLPWVLVFACYTVGAYSSVRRLVLAAALMVVALVVLLVNDTPGFEFGDALTSAVTFGAAMMLGRMMQNRRERIAGFDEEQARAAERAAADERLRIAQELHDVVAHSLGVIAVQAGAGMHVIESDPDEARRALEHIARTSRSSLAEIRRLLGIVRAGQGGPAYEPVPGLADLGRLVEDVRGAGLAVDLQVETEGAEVAPGVQLAAYRIVQEALTNTLRHARAENAQVRLGVDAGVLRVEVTDDGRGPARAKRANGHGLVGMRERVAVYGGSLEAGADPDGGFRVAALLPCGEEPLP